MSTRSQGFTLIEVMIVVVIIAILAAIALPNYRDYVRRSEVQAAIAGLSDARTRMEQYYQDNRFYTTTATSTTCGVANFSREQFDFTCTATNSQSYRWMATGRAGSVVSGFFYDVRENGAQTTTAPAWNYSSAAGWKTRKGD
jgi:type IV pilus assembly protein PilE